MAASVRQFKYADNSATAFQNWTATFNSAVQSGSLIVVGYSIYGSTTDPTMSDDVNGGSYTKDVVSGQNLNTGDIVWLFSLPNTNAGTPTVSIFGAQASYQAVTLIEITGAATSTPKDSSNSAVGNSGTPATCSVTAQVDHDIIIAVLSSYNGTSTIVPGSGLTLVQSDTQTAAGHLFTTMKNEDTGQASGNTITYTYSGGASLYSALAAVAYKLGSQGNAPVPLVGSAVFSGIAGRMDQGLSPRSTIKGQN